MTREELQTRLVAAEAAYVEKTGKQPYIGGARLYLRDAGLWECNLWADRDGHLYANGETPEDAIGAFMQKVADLPDAATANLLEFQRDLGRLIDKGNKLGIDTKWLNPITETARELAENALTYQAAE